LSSGNFRDRGHVAATFAGTPDGVQKEVSHSRSALVAGGLRPGAAF
jgi:hypothetical protein